MMEEIKAGLYRISGDDEKAEFDAKRDEIRDIVSKLVDDQRARLNAAYPDRPWWADAVFFMRDIKSICTVLDNSGQETTAELLAEVCSKTASALFKVYTNDNEALIIEYRDQLMAEGEILDAVMSQAMAKFSGQGVQ